MYQFRLHKPRLAKTWGRSSLIWSPKLLETESVSLCEQELIISCFEMTTRVPRPGVKSPSSSSTVAVPTALLSSRWHSLSSSQFLFIRIPKLLSNYVIIVIDWLYCRDVPNVFGNETGASVPGLKMLFEKCLQDADASVRSSALKAYVSFIIECDEDDKTIKSLGTLAPVIIKVYYIYCRMEYQWSDCRCVST